MDRGEKRVDRTYLTSDTYLAGLYIAAGDLETALRTLNRAVERGAQLVFAGVEPGLDPIRADPRFVAALRKARAYDGL